MPIINNSKDTVLAESFEECRSPWQQFRGMMFRSKVVPLVFFFSREKIMPLHSWFCPDNMDLVFLDENWEVVELQSEWPPRSKYRPRSPSMFLLELPSGTIWKTGTEIGDVVQIGN
jgi:uncharacterized membrane protein (UPF0127 family)